MELTTLTRSFLDDKIIDEFESVIWTERYYGDGDVEVHVPATPEMIQNLAIGSFLATDESDEVMVLETHDIQNNVLKVTGITILKWLNNRFIRMTTVHADRYYNYTGTPGVILSNILYDACISGLYPAGITSPADFVIPGLVNRSTYTPGVNTTMAVPYGPVYDALKAIATTYQIGMTIELDLNALPVGYPLGFRSYKGLDRTSSQSANPVVRFSPQMESFTDIKELQSAANYATRVYSYAPGLTSPLPSTPGYAGINKVPGVDTGFDLRAQMIFADDITTDLVGGDAAKVTSMLNEKAASSLDDHKFAKLVDGSIVSTSQFKYGRDYNLGDVIEVQGHSGVIQHARVTEYIYAQDKAGEKYYPTVEMID